MDTYNTKFSRVSIPSIVSPRKGMFWVKLKKGKIKEKFPNKKAKCKNALKTCEKTGGGQNRNKENGIRYYRDQRNKLGSKWRFHL